MSGKTITEDRHEKFWDYNSKDSGILMKLRDQNEVYGIYLKCFVDFVSLPGNEHLVCTSFFHPTSYLTVLVTVPKQFLEPGRILGG